MEFSYTLEALFAVFRITFWFLLLFGGIAPWLLSYPRDLPRIERLIYSWIGLGGIIVFSIFALSVFHIYHFISIVLTLILIPVVRSVLSDDREGGLRQYVTQLEIKTVIQQIKALEKSKGFYWRKLKKRAARADLSFLLSSLTFFLLFF